MGVYDYEFAGGVEEGMSPYNLALNREEADWNGWLLNFRVSMKDDPDADVADITDVVFVNGVRKYKFGPYTRGNLFASSLRDLTPSKIRIADGDLIKWGVFSRADSESPRYVRLPKNGHHLQYYYGAGAGSPTLPTTLPTTVEAAWPNDALFGMLDYIVNNAPLEPTPGGGSPAQGATINTTNPTIHYHLWHGSDAAFDETQMIHVQVYNSSGAIYADVQFAPTATEVSTEEFSRSYDTFSGVTPLDPNTTYKMKARHQDSWGEWSDFSTERTFTVAPGPSPATSLTPNGKINAISGYNYVANYQHTTGLNANAVEVEVWNAAGTTRLHNTQVTGLALTPGSQYTKPEWHVDLAWATSYTWRIRFRDTNSIWGAWTSKQSFKTNSIPSAPTNLTPTGSVKYAGLTFTAIGTDPDNDDLTGARIQIARVSDNVIVHDVTDTGITINNVSGEISYTVAGGVLVAGTDYKWRICTKDQNSALQGFGAWSGYANFTWVTGATITQVAPSSAQRLNLVRAPTPVADISGNGQDFWTPSLTDGTNTISPITYSDAPSGDDAVWEAVIAGKTLVTSARLTSPFIPVDITKPYLFTLWAQRINSGQTAGMYFNILCYNASSTLVSTIRPSDFGSALNNSNPSTSWTHYGGTIGMVGGTAWPATTTQVKIEIIPSAVNPATVQFTGALAEKLPTFASAGDWTNLKWWYGYFDGGTRIEPTRRTGYGWTGTEGNSEATGVPILENLLAGATKAYTAITYSHTVAKQSDRLYIDQWISNRWVQAHDTGWINSNRTLIPIPSGILRNEERFRLRLQVRDVNSIVVEPNPIEVDILYAGPPEIHITYTEEDAERGRIRIYLENSTLSSDFGGIEIARVAEGEGNQIVARLGTPTPNRFTYEAPASGRTYTFKARQTQIVGSDSVQGRWNSAEARVDYEPNMFLKVVDDPDTYTVGFRLLQNNFQPDVRGAAETRHEIRGRKYPTIFTSEARSHARELTMYLNDGHGFENSIEQRWDMLLEIEEMRPTVVILDSYHKTKMIGKIVGESTLDLGIGKSRRVTFNVEAVDYSEDYRDREGIL